MNKFFVLLALALFLPVTAPADPDPSQPPEIKFTAVDGREVDLAKMKGKVVLVDFWATWCPPCVAEMPDVVATYNKFHKDGFEVIGISLDQDKGAMLAFTKKQGMVWPQYFDGQGWDNKISSSLGITEIPVMFLVGRDGKLIRGDSSLDLAAQVKKALGK